MMKHKYQKLSKKREKRLYDLDENRREWRGVL